MFLSYRRTVSRSAEYNGCDIVTLTDADGAKIIHGLAARYGNTKKELKRVTLDGACGVDHVERVASEIGVSIRWITSKTRKGAKLIGVELLDAKINSNRE